MPTRQNFAVPQLHSSIRPASVAKAHLKTDTFPAETSLAPASVIRSSLLKNRWKRDCRSSRRWIGFLTRRGGRNRNETTSRVPVRRAGHAVRRKSRSSFSDRDSRRGRTSSSPLVRNLFHYFAARSTTAWFIAMVDAGWRIHSPAGGGKKWEEAGTSKGNEERKQFEQATIIKKRAVKRRYSSLHWFERYGSSMWDGLWASYKLQ